MSLDVRLDVTFYKASGVSHCDEPVRYTNDGRGVCRVCGWTMQSPHLEADIRLRIMR